MNNSSNFRVAVIISTYRREAVLIETLESMLQQDFPSSSWQLIVVDQTTRDQHQPATLHYLEKAERSQKLIWLRPPQINFASLPKARNIGIATAGNADLLLFADDDVEVPNTWITAHTLVYKNTKIGGVAGRVVKPGQEKLVNNQSIGHISWWGNFSANYLGDKPVQCLDFMGCNFSIRSSVLKTTGQFEELINSRSAIREDSDLAVRINEAGYQVWFEPAAWAIHKAAASGGTRATTERIMWYYSWFHDHFLFYGKHAPLWRTPFFILHMARPIFACWLYYGKGSSRAFLAPWRGIKDGLRTANRSKIAGQAFVKQPVNFPIF